MKDPQANIDQYISIQAEEFNSTSPLYWLHS